MAQLIIPNEVFFSHIMEEIKVGNSVRIPTKGNSMLPFIRPLRDEIEISPLTDNSIRKGNIVLAETKENWYVVHRIESVEYDTIILRGDGNIGIREKCCRDSVFGEITAIYRGDKRITKTSVLWKIAKNFWFSSPLLRRIYLGVDRRIKRR